MQNSFEFAFYLHHLPSFRFVTSFEVFAHLVQDLKFLLQQERNDHSCFYDGSKEDSCRTTIKIGHEVCLSRANITTISSLESLPFLIRRHFHFPHRGSRVQILQSSSTLLTSIFLCFLRTFGSSRHQATIRFIMIPVLQNLILISPPSAFFQNFFLL